MHVNPRRVGSSRGLATLASLAAAASLVAAACGSDPAQSLGPGSSFVETRLSASGWPIVDLLLVVDDSGSMAQRPYVAEAAAEMVRRLVAPPCVDDRGVAVEPAARAEPGGGCPAGSRVAWEPVFDMNVGVITTSIGAAGQADRCIGDDGAEVLRGDTRAHLMTRWSPEAIDDVPTWQDRGFVAWDPHAMRRCGTEPDGLCAGIADADALVARVQTMVQGVGTGGCGDEAPLEAAWRFLGDPAPPLGVDDDGASLGVDEELLAQRAGFLRPWSHVVVALVTDEDDCSFRRDAVGRYGTDPGSVMPRPRTECATDPDSPCCRSCIEPSPEGCAGDGGCPDPGCQDPATCPGNFHAASNESDRQWRCLDPKRRFGLDLLYPTERYANGFSQLLVNPARLDLANDGSANVVENALIAEHAVHVVTIAPVAWDVVARRNAEGAADLVRGLDAAGVPRGGYQSPGELSASGAWGDLLADVPGNDAPIRLLSVARSLEEGEWSESSASLASIAPPRVDTDGARTLDVGFEAAADELAPSSLCSDSWRRRPAALGVPRFRCGHECFGVELEPDAAGDVACHVIEAYDSDGDRDPATSGKCRCDPGEARLDPEGGAATYAESIRDRMANEVGPTEYDCFCVIPQLTGDPDDLTSDRHHCQNDEFPPEGVDGWCYIDGEAGLGNAELLASCAPGQRRHIRLVGRGEARPATRVTIGCIQE